MRRWSFFICCFTCTMLVTKGLLAQEMETFSFATGSSAYGGEGDDVRGFKDLMLVLRDERPLVVFGVQKRPRDNGRFLYVILFNRDAPKGGFEISGGGESDGDQANTSSKLKLKNCEIDVVYKFEADPKSGKMITESLKLNGKEIAADSPRLFLADLSGEKAKFKPVEFTLPKPPLHYENPRERLAAELMLMIAQLKIDSPDVARFLDVKD